MRKRNIALIATVGVFVVIATGAVRGLRDMGSLEVGVQEIRMPSGAKVYLHRQRVVGRMDDVYLSENGDVCHPYDRWHDYRVSAPIPVGFLSVAGNNLTIHSDHKPNQPWLFKPTSFQVDFQPLATDEDTTDSSSSTSLPLNSMPIRIPFEQNTCVL